MKKIGFFLLVAFMAAIVSSLNSCTKEMAVDGLQDGFNSPSRTVSITDIEYCGEVTTVRLLAGQYYEAGFVTVGNDSENLYVTYQTNNDWFMKKLHLYVGECELLPKNKGGAIPGKFPYKVCFDELQTEYTFVIPLQDLPDEMCVAAHAELVKVVEGEIVQTETGWGEGEKVGNNWSMVFNYEKQECTPPEDVCYGDEETAWAFGPNYNQNGQGNWATYTPYEANVAIDIFAGQYHNIGTVMFSEVTDGKVTITISLIENWVLAEGNETVKIQGYNEAPSGNPAPGQFNTYKGTMLTVTVDAFEFYGIHLDVRPIVDCDSMVQ